MEKSEHINELAAALCKFQGEVEKVAKEATNPFFKSKYASLSNILDVIREPLFSNGLSISQYPAGEHGLTTMLMHSSGQYIMETYFVKPVKDDPQSAGSAITYQRRYAIASILSLNIDDDDGNAASTPAKRQNQRQEARTQPETPKQQPTATFPQLNPKHEKWKGAVVALATGTVTMERLKQTYSIFDHNEAQLLKEVEQYKNQTP